MNNGYTDDIPHWYAIQTKPREEDRADYNLRAWGVETLAPRIRERRLRAFTNQPSYAIKPLFPRYIFARFNADEQLHKICYTRGVHSVVFCGDRPAQVDDETVVMIQARIGKDGFVTLNEELKPGAPVTIKDGMFRGMNGLFVRGLSDSDRVSILLTNLTYQAHITIDRHLVQRTTVS